jgi:chromosome segregation protein
MLKSLELVGFKSFADKTRFDFPSGITAIVGPNGSGKSNVVDAVRWILGEQSAKSLRGGEMADVIFNGSTSRRSLGMAEVTMTFDNSRRRLGTESDEIQVTRRVYRDGEGEYLINQQPCRLKDVKDLFLGSGAGTDAYSVIEQGKVDVLLQASTRDRRTIFEEAAGISRFKAKKIETLRKLERVEVNLQRLGDIVEEVEKQLRSVKLQAAKAQRYQEYSNRLKELRVRLGLEEYGEFTGRLETETAGLDELRKDLAGRAVQADAAERDMRQLEEGLASIDESLHAQEGALAQARQQITAEETTLGHERALSAELETDLDATRSRMTELNRRVGALAVAVADAVKQLAGAEAQSDACRAQVHALEEKLQAAVTRLTALQTQMQADKADHLERMRQAARLQNDVVSYQAQVENLRRERQRLLHRTDQAAEHLAALDIELEELIRADETMQERLAATRQTLADQRQDRERLRHQHDESSRALAELRARRSGLASREEVLEGLERGHEGLGTGVREVMALLDQAAARTPDDPDALWTRDLLLGLVADFLTVRREYAPLIDVALGEKAQRFLVRDPGILADALKRQHQPFSGRVGFLPVARSAPTIPLAELDGSPEKLPGVIAHADQVVNCEHPELKHLPAQLLGRTLIVHDLDSARAITARAPGWRLVTMQGELLEVDGTLTVGAHHAETGILSRKSELRELRERGAELDRQNAQGERALADLRDRAGALDKRLAELQEESNVLAEQSADLRSRLGQRRQQREGLNEEVSTSRSEISAVEAEALAVEESWQEARAQAESADRDVQTIHARLESADREMRTCEQERGQRQQEVTAAKVGLAQAEERLAALQARSRQLQTDLEQRRAERADGERHVASARARLEDSQRTMLQALAALARWYLRKESAERQVADLTRERDLKRHERQILADQAQAIRAQWRERQEHVHTRELESSELRHRRDALALRLREDYQIELTDLYRAQWDQGASRADSAPVPAAAPLDVLVANEEIAELRRKLSRLGSVNMDSLQELAELEARAHTLHTQSDDLMAAKRSLEEIITAINQDSKRLFTETFASIRTHFQELFRKLFGGGMADTVLEDESDILESGIEIIARPPGKELRSISLMSGGEKTLTAVALLLAIFRSKPSPFCILDEVDAALDEANIGRFTAVLRDFLDHSQFIIITHSKKTMSVADVLYGVTMQESGVSKRVAVRFEDWLEEDEPPMPAARNGQEKHAG